MVSPINPVTAPLEVEISSGTSITSAINLNGHTLAGIIMPGSWTTANLTFQMSDTLDGTYVDVYDVEEAELEITADASRFLALDPVNFWSINYLKVRSGTSGTPVNQGADRTLKLMVGATRRR